MKDIFKISIALLVAIIAGLSKLYLDENTNILFYLGTIVSLLISLVASFGYVVVSAE
ncbi:MAG: hypothetical protein COA39_012165 [Sulfurimonas sp.]|nr:hypothetical protein [Sulfurimonas sp.]